MRKPEVGSVYSSPEALAVLIAMAHWRANKLGLRLLALCALFDDLLGKVIPHRGFVLEHLEVGALE